MRVLSILACLLPLMATNAYAATPDEIVPQEINLPGNTVPLRAYLFKPKGAGPFPVVVAMHDCEGLWAGANGLRPSYRDWAERFNGAGLAVLFPDSFGSRELTSQCRVPEPIVRASRDGVADVVAARRWLSTQDWVQSGRLSLVGWGRGANAVLWAVRPQATRVPSAPDFRSAAVLYPGCQRPARLGWSSRLPTLVLVGTKSDSAATEACRQMVDNAKGRSALAQFNLYPEHDVVAEPAATKSADVSAYSAVVRSLAARADGAKRVLDWLAR